MTATSLPVAMRMTATSLPVAMRMTAILAVANEKDFLYTTPHPKATVTIYLHETKTCNSKIP